MRLYRMVQKSNQVGFRLPPDFVDSFHEEASKQKISIHEYAKNMAIKGFNSSQSGGENDQLIAKNTIFSVCLLQELLIKTLPENDSQSAITEAKNKAIDAIKSANIEV